MKHPTILIIASILVSGCAGSPGSSAPAHDAAVVTAEPPQDFVCAYGVDNIQLTSKVAPDGTVSVSCATIFPQADITQVTCIPGSTVVTYLWAGVPKMLDFAQDESNWCKPL